MAEASSIVEEALRDLAVIAQGETPSTEDAVLGLSRLNTMISDWARRGISISSDILISDSPLADDIVDALRINLTLRLAPAFGITLNPVLVETAAETFRALGNRATSPAPDYELNTWGWLVADALQRSTVIMEGMRPSTGQVARGFQYIRRITEQWTLDGLLNIAPFHVDPYVVAADKEQFVYTIGTGDMADISVRSLATVQTISILYPYQNSYESVLRSVDWDTIVRQTRHDLSGTWPTMYYYEAAWPVGCIYFDIQPTAGTTISIVGRADWLDETNLEGAIALPQGYESALVDNLTIELAQAYQKPVSQIMYRMARKSKALLRRRNQKPRISVLPRALMGARANGYSYTH